MIFSRPHKTEGPQMNLEQIGSSVLANLQLLIDSAGIPLAVGAITDEDYQWLSSQFVELNWDFAFAEFGNHDNKFEMTVKLISSESGIPAGAAICTYNTEAKSFDIQFVESFVRHVPDHPLHGKMLKITLIAAYLFCSAVECSTVNVIEPDTQDLMNLYSSFGFRGDDTLMTASIAEIEHVIMSILDV